MLATHKAELNALLEKRSAAEAQFMEGYLGACEQVGSSKAGAGGALLVAGTVLELCGTGQPELPVI